MHFEIQNFVSGDSFDWAFADAEFPASEWESALLFRGPSNLDLPGVAEGDMLHAFALTSELSATLAAGFYTYALTMTRDTERRTVSRGAVEVYANPLDIPEGTDQRSAARIALANIDLAIATKQDVLSFTVFGRSHQYHSFAQLIEARREFARLVEAEDGQARRERGEPSRSVAVFRF